MGLEIRDGDGGILGRNSAIAAVRGRDSLECNVIKADPQPGGAPRFPLLDESAAFAQPPISAPDGGAPHLQALDQSRENAEGVLQAPSAEQEFALTSLIAAKVSTEKTSADLTPFMKQWAAAKHQNPDALVFFRRGDFYEVV